MKKNRYRKAQRTLEFYKMHFGIEPPYRLLVDGTICNAAYTNHVNLADQVAKLFQAEVKLYTTDCAIKEIEGLKDKFGVARGTTLSIIKQFRILQCLHKNVGSVIECFQSRFSCNTNSDAKMKFCVATQDLGLRQRARSAGGVPLFILKSKVPHMEVPSERSEAIAAEQIKSRSLAQHSKAVLDNIKIAEGIVDTEEPQRKRRRIAKGQNPLSCMKKKKKPQTEPTNTGKRARSRKRKSTAADQPEDIVSLIKAVM